MAQNETNGYKRMFWTFSPVVPFTGSPHDHLDIPIRGSQRTKLSYRVSEKKRA